MRRARQSAAGADTPAAQHRLAPLQAGRGPAARETDRRDRVRRPRRVGARKGPVRDGDPHAGAGVGQLDRGVELLGQGFDDAGAQARLRAARSLGMPTPLSVTDSVQSAALDR